MEYSLLVGGFGGQGVVLIGQLIGYAATDAGRNATFFPSYGAEQRGGTANCTVVVSDSDIGSPVVNELDCVIAMNEPSLARFESWVKPGGTIILNRSLIKRDPARKDIRVVDVPAYEEAQRLGSEKAANMVILGAYIGATGALDCESVIATMKEKMASKQKFLATNEAAIMAGHAIGAAAKNTCVEAV